MACTQLVDAYEFDGDGTKWTTLKGGLQTITDAMTQLLQDKYKDTCTIEYNTRVIEVSETNANGKVRHKWNQHVRRFLVCTYMDVQDSCCHPVSGCALVLVDNNTLCE